MDIVLCAPLMESEELIKIIKMKKNVKIDGIINGSQLEEILHMKKYDVAIVALNGARGLEAIVKIRDFDKRLPIIWISNDEYFALISYRYRVHMFIQKPFKEDELLESIMELERGRIKWI